MKGNNQPKPFGITRSRTWKLLAVACVTLVVVAIAYWFEWRKKFPYGWTHCCAKGIAIELRRYAEENNGWLPHGKLAPEASLSLLCANTNMVIWVCGKNIPAAVAQAALARDRVLGPESCGWHYVEGLEANDDPQIAVAWDKIRGLSHNGQLQAGLARSVILLDGSEQGISEKQWPDFIADRKERLAKIIASRDTNSPPIRWSDVEVLGQNHSIK